MKLKQLKYLILLTSFNASAEMLNPNVTENNYKNTICITNYSKSIRPSSYITNKIKKELFKINNISEKSMKNYQLDHIVPLSIGGAILDKDNLQLQKYSGNYNAHDKDRLEHQIHKDVCNDKISLKDAQNIFKNDWRKVYDEYYRQ